MEVHLITPIATAYTFHNWYSGGPSSRIQAYIKDTTSQPDPRIYSQSAIPRLWTYKTPRAQQDRQCVRPTPVSIVDPDTLTSNTNLTTPQVQPSGTPVSCVHPLHRSGLISLPLLLWTQLCPLVLQSWYPFCRSQALPAQLTFNCQHPQYRWLLTLAGNLKGRTTPQTGVILRLPVKTVKIRIMVWRFCTVAPTNCWDINGHFVGKVNTPQKNRKLQS